MGSQSTWRDHLARYALFDEAFFDHWGNQTWPLHDDPKSADDTVSAAKLHMQLVSRITTQRLYYSDGVEAAALKSVYELFGAAREIFQAHPRSRLTDAVSWYVINTHVRPFTARWHRQSERGGLSATDASDVFRDELLALQRLLIRFDALLVEIRDGIPPTQSFKENIESDRDKRITEEMGQSLGWGIDPKLGGLSRGSAEQINAKEMEAIKERRRYYQWRLEQSTHATDGGITLSGAAVTGNPKAEGAGGHSAAWVNRPHATALAISGGGIRSATFALGVLVALARRNLLFQFDYLSTVSGGGYLGTFLTTFLNGPSSKIGDEEGDEQPQVGLLRNDLPFRRQDGEAAALRYVRHHSKYLVTGRLWERLQMAFTQVYGMALNGLGFAYLALVAAVAEHGLRQALPIDSLWKSACLTVATTAAAAFLTSMVAEKSPSAQSLADAVMTIASIGLVGLLFWKGLSYLHFIGSSNGLVIACAAAVPLVSSGLLVLVGRRFPLIRPVLIGLSALAAPVLFFGLEQYVYDFVASGYGLASPWVIFGVIAATFGGPVLFYFFFDINFTSPNRYYKRKLSEAYLLQLNPSDPNASLVSSVSLRVSECAQGGRVPYHLINCALNVPASQNPAMQGRLTDFFLFSPYFSGSPLLDYSPTSSWEAANHALDLGTAMTVSGAAAAPQMGLGTIRNLSFWLAIFNVRLGYWIRNPAALRRRARETPPGLFYLLQEMFGWANEKRTYVNISDGGHIENLGIYELLRRRCKFIVAIDGEQDSKMTFQGLTTLQRLAFIDLGVTLDIGLDPLRLNDEGLSNSHFAFCRIRYPSGSRDGPENFGYLIYLKLSLTGNEGEFIRRYRIDEPAFPHHSTADQFFTEAQFEAYRSLGEHIGDKMFLPAIVGPAIATANSVELEQWFVEIGKSMLEPLP
ncbi:hypothetical protein [Bradyrhizobium sp.]|uniref:hypothetical protein n=1 Tax=Bradyrhizobium sp. TaxID=376 RepID=UPI002DDD9949|nr:hypothetical protein [Bradyrhizobium sp.]HEV2153002.1 hypothetical protein [Bradyrhizobium sp.]